VYCVVTTAETKLVTFYNTCLHSATGAVIVAHPHFFALKARNVPGRSCHCTRPIASTVVVLHAFCGVPVFYLGDRWRMVFLLCGTRAVYLALLNSAVAVTHDCTFATPGIDHALVRSCISLSLTVIAYRVMRLCFHLCACWILCWILCAFWILCLWFMWQATVGKPRSSSKPPESSNHF